MSEAPAEVKKAILETLKYAMVFCRNYTLGDDVDVKLVNELMEAIHDLPDQVYNWSEEGLEKVFTHLNCFDCSKWKGSPKLSDYFEDAYRRAVKHG